MESNNNDYVPVIPECAGRENIKHSSVVEWMRWCNTFISGFNCRMVSKQSMLLLLP
ncbi:hypothetical protein [Porphyromonas macacae]|uniref:hypothetical protein n=1 Tax=Porphyromonas macacae TaxID=28115 RepID=UPI00359F546F